jgi:cytochrome c biogenesis protein
MRQILNVFKSVKLAVTLILYIVITSILATLIPQVKEIAFYHSQYPPLLASIIIATQFHIFFRSILFLVPALFFCINLAVCAIDRLIRELRKKSKLRMGVDLVHLGILVLVVGGIISAFGRKEGFQYLGEGDEVNLPAGQVLRLETFEFRQYPDGRPKDWISVVDIEKNGEIVKDSFPIEVNRPLQVGAVKIYQASYAKEIRLTTIDDKGNEYTIHPGQFVKSGKFAFRYRHAEKEGGSATGYRIIFEKWEGHSFVEPMQLSISDKLGDFVIKGVLEMDVTGLQFVIDPGYLPVFISLILITIGLSITYIQKIGDKRI